MQLTVLFFLFVPSLFMSEGITESGWGKTLLVLCLCGNEYKHSDRNRISVGLKPKPSDPHALTQHKSSADHPDREERQKGGKKFFN